MSVHQHADAIMAKVAALATTETLKMRAEQIGRLIQEPWNSAESLQLVLQFLELMNDLEQTPYFKLDALAGFVLAAAGIVNRGMSSSSSSDHLLLNRSRHIADATVLDMMAATARPIAHRDDLSCPAHAFRACAQLGARELGVPVRALVIAARDAAQHALGASVTIESNGHRVCVDFFGNVVVERRTLDGSFVGYTDNEVIKL